MMKAKLIKKSEIHYDLMIDTHGLYTSTYQWTSNGNLLSLKNCQAIENGYDLDELVNEVYPIPENSILPIITMNMASRRAFKAGFQKALSILGDKKFSEEQMKHAYLLGRGNETIVRELGASNEEKLKYSKDLDEGFENFISPQQTEWDVEVEMICPHPADTYRCGIQYGCDEDGCNHPNQVPYLDPDGCIILKRV